MSVLSGGVFASLITVFKDTSENKQEIDIEANKRHIEYLQKSGIKGALVLGSTGEQVALTRDERKQLIESLCVAVTPPNQPDPRIPKGPEPQNEHNFHNFIMAGVGGQSIQESLTLAEDAAGAGAKYAVAYPPSFYATNMTPGALESFYTELADKSPIPVLIYSGVVSGVNIEPASVEHLAKHEKIVGIIQSSVDGPSKNTLHVFPKTSGNLLGALQADNDGVITPMANFFPRTIQQIYDQNVEAETLQDWLSAAEEDLQKYGMPAVKHATAHLRGYTDVSSVPRRPIPPPSAEAIAVIEKLAASDLSSHEKKLENGEKGFA